MIFIRIFFACPHTAGAETAPIQFTWGGQLKASAQLADANGDTRYRPVGEGTLLDGSLGLRIKNQTFFSDRLSFEAHYEGILSGGERHKKDVLLARLFSGFSNPLSASGSHVDDERRLVDLTGVVSESDDSILYQRIDRLVLSWQEKWGRVRIGRQAVTWGNGLIFNPMDLFNPFAPTDIERDYKIGDDMLSGQFPLAGIGDLQALYVARRNPQSGRFENDQTSWGLKLHIMRGTTEFDLMGARHYSDSVVGGGASGYLGEAGWRIDLTWTFLDADRAGKPDHYPSLVANLDYAWTWWGKNFYGFIEYYENGLGEGDYAAALADPAVSERLMRGELFTLGEHYLSTEIQIEVHPLCKLYFTLINNISDPSGLFIPRLVWDIRENLELTFGAQIAYGGDGTEFGGFEIPSLNLNSRSPDLAYLWVTWFF